MAGPKRPIQAVDANANPLTCFAEAAIRRMPVPADGRWHRVAVDCLAVRLHVFPARAGVIYTTSRAAAVAAGDPVDADTIEASIPLPAGGNFTLLFAGPVAAEVFVARDPDADAMLAPPILGVVQSAGA